MATNPDNAGGLRPGFSVDEALLIADQNADSYKEIASVSRTLAAEVRRLRETCFVPGTIVAWVQPKQLKWVGGRGRRPKDGVSVLLSAARTVARSVPLYSGELCRAAPAGGDVSAHVMNLIYMKAGYNVTLPEREAALDAAIYALQPVSAPAGSGEVDVSKLSADDAANCDDQTFAEWLAFCGKTYEAHGSSYNIALPEASRRIAALLRKLQQGADEGRSRAYDQVDRFLRNNLGDEAYAKYSDALEVACGYAASQGQEGGTDG